MARTKRRHTLTETEPIRAALDDAAQAWPADAGRPTRLLSRLIEEGHANLLREAEELARERARVLDSIGDEFVSGYPPGYLDDLRGEWPS